MKNDLNEDITPNEIKFYKTTEAYGEFSNFAKYPVFLKSKLWPTNEHYFQAQKFAGTELEETIRFAPTAFVATKLGRSKGTPIRDDWNNCKDNIMRKVVFAKFTQHECIGRMLINTGSVQIIEHTKNDFYWGDGENGEGLNMLGKILIEMRDLIRGLNLL
ncbi:MULTISPECIES: NADAR family protein [Methylobacterium]|uniref:Uncharacterized protein conserved in bacteria n=2 Tax=Methylobacterium TaxID=407 RepID=A0A1Y0ZC55_9HYPH|nr:NADAR family protein [Methylobacterium aquaticum]BAR47340.1 uncharacterized protein conserved in bacteria [Methylobacterium aquaticum]